MHSSVKRSFGLISASQIVRLGSFGSSDDPMEIFTDLQDIEHWAEREEYDSVVTKHKNRTWYSLCLLLNIRVLNFVFLMRYLLMMNATALGTTDL